MYRSNIRNKFGASFLAAILLLTAMTTIFAFSAPAGAICPTVVAEANGPYSGYTGDTINFDSTGSYTTGGTIVLYEWDFDGDGTYDWSSPSTGMTTHIYSNYGTYTAVLRVTNDCGGTDTDTATVKIYQENPELTESCGIDIVLVFDGSGSIDATEYSQMQTAFVDFVNAFLPNTPTEMAIVEFATLATLRQGFTSDATTLINEINEARVQPGGEMTNWQQGLLYAHNLFPNRGKPDLIIFASDGDPNRQGNPASATNALGAAVDEANLVKSDGIRIITLGIGTSINANNLKAISSIDAYYSTDFETLADTLSDIASELCGGTVTVRKYVDDAPAQNWEFTAIVTDGTPTPSSGYTDANGYIVFTIDLDEGEDVAYVDIVETPQDGYNFVTATAEDCAGGSVGTLSGASIIDIPVESTCAIYAEFYNTEVTDECSPTTTKTFSGPTYGEDNYWVTLDTEITLTAVDCPLEEPSGIAYIHYEIWWDSDFNDIIEEEYDTKVADEEVCSDTVTFTFTEECLHLIKWYAVDLAGNQEQTHYQYHRVDNTGPDQSIVLGEPQLTEFYLHPNGNYYTVVGNNTPIYLTSDDTHEGTKNCAVGSHSLVYFYHWGYELNEWEESYGPFEVHDGDPEDISSEPGIITVVIDMDESCWHEIHLWCEDELGNQGIERYLDFIVDANKPTTTHEYIGPGFYDDVQKLQYVHCSTFKRINATDTGCILGGSGVEYIHWWVQRILEGGSTQTIAQGDIYDGVYDYEFDNGLVYVTGENDPDYGEMQIEITVMEHCEHYIFYQAFDYVENSGKIEKQKIKVDCKPPVTTKTIGIPQYDMGYWVTTETLIELDAVDQEEPCVVGVKEIHYRYGYDQDDSGEVEEDEFYPWVVVCGDHAEFTFTEECLHRLEWYAVDNFGNTEETHVQYHKVDNTPPLTTKTIGTPQYDGGYWVTLSTLFELDAVDLPPGCPAEVAEICYRIGWDENEDEIIEESEFDQWICTPGDHVEFYMPQECYHKLEWYAIDNLGNTEDVHEQYHRVDNTPPVTIKTVGTPQCQDELYVTTSTPITLTATDYDEPCAVGVEYIYYEIWWDSDNNGVAYGDTLKDAAYVNDDEVTLYFTEDCLHLLRWFAVDYLGNTEQINEQYHRVDTQPPQTVKTFYGPTYMDNYWVTLDTEITLTATDYAEPCAVGDVTLYWEVWWDSDNDNVVDIQVNVDIISQDDDYVTFKFLEECLHEIRWYAVDCLGNTELLQTQQHRVDDTPPVTLKTFIGPTWDDPTYGEDYWLQDHGTTIVLDATDYNDPCAVGVEYLYVELWKSMDEGQTWSLVWEEIITGDYYEFQIFEDCYHAITWYAVDYLGNGESQNVQFHQVDSQPPITTKTVNNPECQDEFYVTKDTLIELDAVDQQEPCAVGVKEIHYRVGWDENGDERFEEGEFDSWVIVSGDHAEFYFGEDCYHKIEWYAVDYLTNTEQTHEQYHRVDTQPPQTVKTFSGPTYEDNYWVTKDTEITLTATDYAEPCAVGSVKLYWEVWWDSDNNGIVDTQVKVDIIESGAYFVTFKFLEECLHEIHWYAIDCLGNAETEHIQQHRVDDTPPVTEKSFDGPTWDDPEYGEDYWLQDHGTEIILEAYDYTDPCAVGVEYIHVELWWDSDQSGTIDEDEMVWSEDVYHDYYDFDIEEDCLHEIRWYAVDYLGNTERTHYQQHRVDSQPPVTTKSFDGPTCSASEEDILKFGLETKSEIENFWLRDHDTWVMLNSVDQQDPCAVGVDYIHVELWNSIDEGETWNSIWTYDIDDDYYEFQIYEDCLHKIVWYAVDLLGNTEETHVQYHRVDSQPPDSQKTFEGPTYGEDNYWVTSDTDITLTAIDMLAPCDVGVVGFHVMIEWDQDCDGNFITIFDDDISDPYTITFTLKEMVENYGSYGYYEGRYRITWGAYDCLGNIEETKVQYHQVDDTGPHVIIIKPTDGFYSDGSSIPSIIFSEDIANPHSGSFNCGAVGIEDGKQGYAYLIDVFPDFSIVELDTTNLLYDEESHEYIGNAIIPNPSGIPDGAVLFVAVSEDNLGNSWNSLFELLHVYFIQAVAECGEGNEECCMSFFADLIADFIADQNIVWIGIDNTAPEVEIVDTEIDVGTIYVKADAFDVFSGIESGAPCYITLGGVSIGTLPYDLELGGCEGTLSTAGVPGGVQTLTVSVYDRAGCMGSDSTMVDVPILPGPTTSGTDVQPASSIIGTELTVTATTFSTIANIADADFYVIDYWGNTILTGNLDPVDGVFDETSEDIIAYIDTDGWDAGYYTIYVRGQDDDGRWGAYDEEEFSLVEEAQWRPVVCNIITPTEDDVYESSCDNKFVHVIVEAYRPAYNGLPKDYEVEVTIWLDQPYGAPDLFYEVTWDGEDKVFTADVPFYWYSSGAELNLEAKAEDPYYNRAYDDTTFSVITTIEYDRWLEAGWNGPINLALLGCDDSVESVLASIDADYEMIFEIGTWWNYHNGHAGNTLHVIDPEAWYWIKMNNAARFYIDNNCPYVTIEYPEDEVTYYDNCFDDFWGYACDIETSVVEVVLTIYDDDTGLYWDGADWVPDETELACIYDDITEAWYYPGTGDLDFTYLSGHEFMLTATATDMAGCSCYDTAWFMFVDDNAPYIEISYPEDEVTYDDCEEPSEIYGIAYDWNCETIVTCVFIQIRDETDGLYWDGDSWEESSTDLPCIMMFGEWLYDGVLPEWTDGHEYSIYAMAYDAADNIGYHEIFFYYECELPELYDFGDAPDPTYPTLLASDGARHGNPAPYMGIGKDEELDGLPTFNADGDDNDAWDDEDGVFFYPLYPGYIGGVDIDMTWTPFDGYLNAWIDFNQDGDWDDVGEQIFIDEYLTYGTVHYALAFMVPEDAVLGDTYARFRINSLGGLTYTGYAEDGEVEDYIVTIEEEPCEPAWSVTKETWCYSSEMWWYYGYARYEDNHARFRITFENTGSCPITDFIIEDELPGTLVFDITTSVTVPGASGITYTENYDVGENDVTWDFTGTLLPGETVEVVFEANFVGTVECIDTNCAIGQPDGYMGILAYSDIYYWCPN